MSTYENTSTPALIIAYRRSEQVLKIIDILSSSGITKIYIALDAPAGHDVIAKVETDFLLECLLELQQSSSLDILIAKHSKNVGCSAAVLSACEWFFSSEEFGIVLEDDCIPSPDFISYVISSKFIIDSDPNFWLACGTQFAPSELIKEPWIASCYALIWGWATSSKKWRLIFDSIKSPQRISSSCLIGQSERQYWNAGALRSWLGIVDAWDNILISQLVAQNAKAILPSSSLVSNVGFDSFATHTKKYSKWMDHQPSTFSLPRDYPRGNSQAEEWISKYFYRIKLRHLVSTRITQLMDLITGKRAKAISLNLRTNNALANFIFY